MTAWFGKVAISAALAVALFSPSSSAANGISIRSLGAEEMRLSTIAYRIGAASARMCTRRDVASGLILHDLTQYDPEVRGAVSSAFSLADGFGVLQIIPGSAADRAGLHIDDEIIRVGDIEVTDPAAVANAQKSYDRTDRFLALLKGTLSRGTADIVVRRQGQVLHLELRGQPSCGGDLILTNSSELNAWSDGSHVVITTGIAALADSPDEIAFVIAHEMAHNILGHSTEKARGLFGGIAQTKEEEMEADSFAVTLMHEAGYDPEGGISFLHKVSRRLWWAISLDHPGFGRRIQIVNSAIAALTRSTAAPHLALWEPTVPPQSSESVQKADASLSRAASSLGPQQIVPTQLAAATFRSRRLATTSPGLP
jgi:hypothetical protein